MMSNRVDYDLLASGFDKRFYDGLLSGAVQVAEEKQAELFILDISLTLLSGRKV